MLRATLLKFSSEVSNIADDIEKKDTAEKVNDLYKRYIQFVNSFYFREITPKEQGLEIYEKAIDILNIQRDVKDLDAEIEELHKYVEIQQKKVAELEAEKTNKKLNNISLYGGVLLGTSVLTGFFGMNVGSDDNFSSWIVYPLIILSIYSGYRYFKGQK
jgi:Mg2+ and Co2+ transporter CorA